MQKSNFKEVENFFKKKKLLFATWASKVKEHNNYRDWRPFLKKFFGKMVVFSPRNHYFRYGKEELNKKFLEIVKKEKPDYIFLGLSYDEFYLETLLELKKLSPKIKTINYFGDDDWRYDDWSRYYAIFFDYCATYKKDLSPYYKDKIKRAHFLFGINTEYFRPTNVKKIYDISFIGMPLADRQYYMKFLMNSGLNVKLFGIGWSKYPELKQIYGGYLTGNDFPKTINQTKINLNFTKTFYKKGKRGQLKSRILEVFACKSFVLTEHSPFNEGIAKRNKKINFRNKKELLEKIKYFLEHVEERNKIALEGYKEAKKEDWNIKFKEFFEKVYKEEKDFKKQELPKINKKIEALSRHNFADFKTLKSQIKEADYITFTETDSRISPHKNYFQAYSLEKSGKDIGICDYYVSSPKLGNYLLFTVKKAFNELPREDFISLICLSQLIVTKDFFLKHINDFKKFYDGWPINLLNEKNTVFVSIPLVEIEKIKKVKFENMQKAFKMKFLDKLYSLAYQKNFFSSYPYKLFLESLTSKPFILKQIYKSLLCKEYWDKLKKF